LEHAARRFLARLEEDPHVEVLGAFCQSAGQSVGAVWSDLWRRRGWLAGPLFALWIVSGVAHALRDRSEGRRLAGALRQLQERIHYVPDIHHESVLARVRLLAPDLGLVYGSPILRAELFEIPTMGTLGIHHGTLPRYRGKKTTFWEMYEGEGRAGVTIQLINRGLDTGEIVREGSVEIGARTRSAVWKELEELGLDLYERAVTDMRTGTAAPRPQLGQRGPLYRDPPAKLVMALWWRQLLKRMGRSG
jgi:hypothetical protein